jgi:hypothetical protein
MPSASRIVATDRSTFKRRTSGLTTVGPVTMISVPNKQDDGNSEPNQRRQAVPEHGGPDDSQPIGTNDHPEHQQQNDARHSNVVRQRLRQHPSSERQRNRKARILECLRHIRSRRSKRSSATYGTRNHPR